MSQRTDMRAVREHREVLLIRVRALTVLVVTVITLITGSYWYHQLVRGAHYANLADNNRLRKLSIRAPRGLIFDRHGKVLVENIPSYDLMLDRSRADDIAASLVFAAGVLERPVERLAAELEKASNRPDFVPVPVAGNLTLAQVAQMSVTGREHPEFEIRARPLRLYRHGPQTAHVLGYIGHVSKQDLATQPGFLPGDRIGKDGIEQTYDSALRGGAGQQVVVVDSRGKSLQEQHRKPADPGQDLHLTLDLRLQQAAEELMRDRTGAVVALDPRNGEIRAMVSSPPFDPNQFARGLGAKQWQALLDDPQDPLQNRTVRNSYAPGSVFKIIMAFAGLQEGVINESERVYCRGSATIYGHRFGCDRRSGHGWVNLREAIERSCNVYFYHLGQTLGIETIARYARAFGMGTATGVDLSGEKVGLVPDNAWSEKTRGTRWYAGETISVAIGQGPLLVTPLQTARLMAAVANGGALVRPHLVRGAFGEEPPPRLPGSMRWLDPIRDGLRAVVNAPTGTAYWNARLADVEVAGKTGTVQVISRAKVDGELSGNLRNHGWFASFAPADDPQLVIVVFAEHGESGSSGAAPIAKALYEEFFASRAGTA
ncbi:MAG: penicillin-binding protein 2 [Acidobacteriota bacterium]